MKGFFTLQTLLGNIPNLVIIFPNSFHMSLEKDFTPSVRSN